MDYDTAANLRRGELVRVNVPEGSTNPRWPSLNKMGFVNGEIYYVNGISPQPKAKPKRVDIYLENYTREAFDNTLLDKFEQ